MGSISKVRYFCNGVPSDAAVYGDDGDADSPPHDWASMLGPTLRVASGEEKPTVEVLANKKNVALVFAGQWCPWCRAFDPYLTQTYLNVKGSDENDTEIVYLSVDTDEEAFGGVVSEKPWPAVPYNRAQGNGEAPIGFVRKKVREAGKPQGTLGTLFGVASVPTVIVLDGQSGRVLNQNFIDERNGDLAAAGHQFNAKAPISWLELAPEPMANPWPSLLGPTLVSGGSERPTVEVLSNKKHVALYFGGGWCPWCTAFEPFLATTHSGLKSKAPEDLEIVYLSVDDDEAAFNSRVASLQYPAVPFNRAQGIGEDPISFIRKKVRTARAEKAGNPELANDKGALAKRFGITATPFLIVLDGKTGAKMYEDFITEKGEKPMDGHAWTPGKAPSHWMEYSSAVPEAACDPAGGC